MSEELKQLEIKAENGDFDAQKELGKYFFDKEVFKKSLKYYLMAAEQGDSYSQYSVGHIYSQDDIPGFYQDKKEAFKWLKLSADNGNDEAQYLVALMYKGTLSFFVETDKDKALEYCNLAANQYHEEAMKNLFMFEQKPSSGGCYIATMVYSDYNAPEVMVFRRFRDQVLKKSIIGRVFIRVYYATSPYFVKIFENSRIVNSSVKWVLDKVLLRLEGK